MESAVDRWQAIIDARAQQMDAAYARLGRTSADFWDRRARGFHRATRDGTRDPFYALVARHVGPRTTVVDVGAGTGRFSVALAALAERVIAVEPNGSMLGILREELAERRIHNVEVHQARWEDCEGIQADIVVASHVLYPIADAAGFLHRLDAATRRCCFVTMRGLHLDALTDRFWRHFHGEPRRLPPTYVDGMAVLEELGILADATVLATPQSFRYPDLDMATDEFAEQLILPDDVATRAELRLLLADWLIPTDDGLRPPLDEMPVGVLSWGPESRIPRDYVELTR